jgi:hypothetical protein
MAGGRERAVGLDRATVHREHPGDDRGGRMLAKHECAAGNAERTRELAIVEHALDLAREVRGIVGLAFRPVTPSSTISLRPDVSVTTTGHACSIASSAV